MTIWDLIIYSIRGHKHQALRASIIPLSNKMIDGLSLKVHMKMVKSKDILDGFKL